MFYLELDKSPFTNLLSARRSECEYRFVVVILACLARFLTPCKSAQAASSVEIRVCRSQCAEALSSLAASPYRCRRGGGCAEIEYRCKGRAHPGIKRHTESQAAGIRDENRRALRCPPLRPTSDRRSTAGRAAPLPRTCSPCGNRPCGVKGGPRDSGGAD